MPFICLCSHPLHSDTSRSSIDMIEVSVDFAVKINAYLSYAFNFSYVCGECSYSFGLVDKSKFL